MESQEWPSRWQRVREWMRLLRHTRSCGSGNIELNYPADSWYAENAPRLLGILEKTAGKLERALDLELPTTFCYVVEPETAEALQGTTGAAYNRSIVVGVPPGRFSILARVGAHELAHILSRRVDEYELPFENEGFACWAAWLIGAERMPVGIPLHYHLGWLLSVGVKPRLADLWHRADYTPELYDLAWSFATYVAGRFGQESYLAFYGCKRHCLHDRLMDTLGLTPDALERDWHDHARRVLGPHPERVARMRRWPGYVCRRAAWLTEGLWPEDGEGSRLPKPNRLLVRRAISSWRSEASPLSTSRHRLHATPPSCPATRLPISVASVSRPLSRSREAALRRSPAALRLL